MDYLMQHGMMFEGGLLALMALMVVAGFVGSIGHCASMCGPFVLAQVKSASSDEDTKIFSRLSDFMILPYHFGRMTTYALLGGVMAFIGDMVMREAGHQLVVGGLLVVAGVIFMISALPYKFIGRFVPALRAPKAITNLIARLSAPFSRHQGGLHRYIYGVLLGFMPCGFLYAALMVVAATGDPMMGVMGMALFAVGTTPPLLMMAIGGTALARKYPSFTDVVTRGSMLFNSFTLFILAGGLLAS